MQEITEQTSSFWRRMWFETRLLISATSFSVSDFDCSCTVQVSVCNLKQDIFTHPFLFYYAAPHKPSENQQYFSFEFYQLGLHGFPEFWIAPKSCQEIHSCIQKPPFFARY